MNVHTISTRLSSDYRRAPGRTGRCRLVHVLGALLLVGNMLAGCSLPGRAAPTPIPPKLAAATIVPAGPTITATATITPAGPTITASPTFTPSPTPIPRSTQPAPTVAPSQTATTAKTRPSPVSAAVSTSTVPAPAPTATVPTPVPASPTPCSIPWALGNDPPVCPEENAKERTAAAQFFERGVIVWQDQKGYLIFWTDSYPANLVDIVPDPVRVNQDTSADFVPPPGLYAPTSGIGLVWRGDVDDSAGYRDRIGWALGPETGYRAVEQCGTTPVPPFVFTRICYLTLPDERTIRYSHPVMNWWYE